MGTILKYMALCGVAGVLLAAGGWVCWCVLWIVLIGSAWDEVHTIWLALGVGGMCAALAGGCLSFQSRRIERQMQQQLAASKALLSSVATDKKADLSRPAMTKRKRSRHPLARSLLRARFSPALRWRKLSKSLQELLRCSRADIIGQPIWQQLHPEDVPALDKALQEARATRQIQRVLCRFQVVAIAAPVTKQRDRPISQSDTNLLPALTPNLLVDVRLELYARLDAAGKVRWYDCRLVDLTPELRRKEQELHTARKEMTSTKKRMRAIGRDLARLKLSYHELYHNAPVMYFSINSKGDLVTFNDTLLRMLGYDRHKLRGRNYTDLLSPSVAQQHVSMAQRMPRQEGEFETQWRRQDGSLINVWIHTVPVYDDHGQFARHRSAALDLTEKNRLANELRGRGDELERMNQRLRGINTELEDFTHVVSHDLKEPLRTLQAYSHILAEEHAAQLGPDGFQYINHLIRASRRMGTLIDELLHLSRAGRITRTPEAFNLIEIVATVRQDLVDLIQRKQATLVTEGSLPDLSGDPVRITQLMTNLVANGLKYNQAPLPRVVIGARPCAEEPGRVTIFVRDNGIGIDPAFHKQIFGIFRRLHQNDEYEGTGAGLAICKKIVEGHGGAIWVESQLGQGATFLFTLPRPPDSKGIPPRNSVLARLQDARADASPSGAVRNTALAAETQTGLASPRIVLVEDQPEVGMIIQKLGKRDGLSITWFPNAEDAWGHLQHRQADLLLLDVNLPGMDGVELCRRLRTLPHLQDTLIAIFTPEQDEEPLQELRAAGANFFLSKDLLCQPVQWQNKIQELLEAIRQPLAH